MSKKDRVYHEHWYSGITEAISLYLPWSKPYHTIQGKRARTGTVCF